MTVTPLHTDMDALKVGPGGQTLGELKEAVLRARQLVVSSWSAEASDRASEALNDATRMLRAAYIRMGLPPKTP